MSKKSKTKHKANKKPFHSKAENSSPKSKHKLIEGVVRINPRGFGFLQVYTPEKVSYLIAHHDVAELMDGDKIVCSLERNNDKIFAKPFSMVQRAHQTLAGRLIKTERSIYFDAQGNLPRPRFNVVNAQEREWRNQSSDTLFKAEIINYPSAFEVGKVRLSKVIGIAGALSTEIALLMSAADVDFGFDKDLLDEASAYREDPSQEETDARKDLTPLSFCTIDGETAKDFDDAVYAQKTKGGVRVRVAIADVSHYVKPGTHIDTEAYRRGSSLYFPGSCVPMLPEHLSNGLCSLKPLVPRLVMVAEFMVSPDGDLSDHRFFRAVIRSKARLTYKQVQAHFDGKEVELIRSDKHLVESLEQIFKASSWLRAAREERGAIDFDSVESHVALNDNGEPINIRPEQRLASHKVIEDLMIAANEAVAQFIEENDVPCVYRVHEAPDPDKFANFVTLAQKLGVITAQDLPSTQDMKDPKILSRLLFKVREHSARDALETLFLRSMMQARYGSENIGHFGLASQSYLHFTSPIRRYPDLVAHRVLEQLIERKKRTTKKVKTLLSTEKMTEMSQHLSDRERKIVEVERNITALFSCWYMKDKVGEEDDGIIVSCTEFGIFVRLSRFHVDGLVHIANLGAGHNHFDPELMRIVEEGSNRSFGIGDKIKVIVAGVNIERRHIDLSLATEKKKESMSRKAQVRARKE